MDHDMNSSLSRRRKKIEIFLRQIIVPFVDERMNVIRQNQQLNLDSYCSFNSKLKYKIKLSRDFVYYLRFISFEKNEDYYPC
jgi:hypothetical protein